MIQHLFESAILLCSGALTISRSPTPSCPSSILFFIYTFSFFAVQHILSEPHPFSLHKFYFIFRDTPLHPNPFCFPSHSHLFIVPWADFPRGIPCVSCWTISYIDSLAYPRCFPGKWFFPILLSMISSWPFACPSLYGSLVVVSAGSHIFLSCLASCDLCSLRAVFLSEHIPGLHSYLYSYLCVFPFISRLTCCLHYK